MNRVQESNRLPDLLNEISQKCQQDEKVIDLSYGLKDPVSYASVVRRLQPNIKVPNFFVVADSINMPQYLQQVSMNDQSFTKVVPELNVIVVSDQTNVYVLDIFQTGVLFTLQRQARLLGLGVQNAPLQHFGRNTFILSLLFENAIVCLSAQNQLSDQLTVNVDDEQITYSDASEAPFFRFQEIFSQELSTLYTSIASGAGRTFIGNQRGSLSELEFGSSQGAGLTTRSHYIPLYHDFIGKKQGIKQMIIDETRGILYTLGYEGQIFAYTLFEKGQPCFHRIKSQVQQSDTISIAPVSNSESYVCFLVGIDCYGSETFYTLNDQQPYQHIDLRQIDDVTILQLKPLIADRYRPNIQNSNFQKIFRNAGVSLLANPHHLFGRLNDQSNSLKNLIEIDEEINFLEQDEIVFDIVELQGQNLINQLPTAEVQLNCGNFSTRQFVAPNRFFVALTNKRIVLLYIRKPYEIFASLLDQLSAIQSFDLIATIYGQQEALLMLVFLAAIYKQQIDIPQQLLSKKCCNIIMNSYNNQETQDLQQIRRLHSPKAFDLLQQKIQQGQVEDIYNVIIQLISRLVYSIMTYQLYYIPFLSVNKELTQYSANNYEIPLKQCQMLSSMTSFVQPFLTFNFIQLFNLGVMLNDFQQFLQAMQSKLDVASKPMNTYQQYNQIGGNNIYKPNNKNLLISEIASSLKYIKELVFFFSLAFNLQNINKVLPEFQEMAKELNNGKCIDLPIFSRGVQRSESLYKYIFASNKLVNINAFNYIQCTCFSFRWFLEVKNKQYMEKLVRRLNILGGEQQMNMTRTKSVAVQHEFQEEFKQLCEILSQVYGSRLSALQQLEQASLPSTSALMKRQYVQQALKSLQQNQKSLLPVAPLVNLFARCDQIGELIGLILKCKFKQNDFYIRNVLEVLRSAEVQQKSAVLYNNNSDNGIQNFNAIYQQQAMNWIVENDDSIKSPYMVQTVLDVLGGQFFDEAMMQNQQMILQQTYRNSQFNVNLNNLDRQIGQFARMSSSDFEEFKEFVSTIFNIIEQQYLFAGFSKLVKDQQVSNVQMSEFKTRGLSIILACIKGSFVEFWHNELYQFIYWHYYNSYCIIEAMSAQDQKQINKQQLQCFELVKRRAVEALLSIQSPFISQFLQKTDHELYLRYLDRAGQQLQFIKVVHDLIQKTGGVAQASLSIKPNTLINNRWERRELNFNQISFLIQNTYHKLSGNQDVGSINASQYGANSVYQMTSSTFPDSQSMLQQQQQQIPEQDIGNYLNFFYRQGELCKIQQEMINRLRKLERTKEPSTDLQQLQATLLSCQQLDAVLKRNSAFDLSLILQYNAIQVQPSHEFLQNTWRAMLTADSTEVGFKQDLEQVLRVFIRTKLDPQQLLLPIKLLIDKFAGCFNTRTAQFAQIFVQQVFHGKEAQFTYVGKLILAAVSACLDFNHKPVQVEVAGFLVVQLLDAKTASKNWALDDQAVSSAQAKQRVARVCQHCCSELVAKLRV